MLSKGEKWLLARNSESLIQSWSLLSIMEGIWLELSTKRYEPLENSEWVAKGSEWGAGEEGGDYCHFSRGGSGWGQFYPQSAQVGRGESAEGRRPCLQSSGWIRLTGRQDPFLPPFCIPLCYGDEKLNAFPRLSDNQLLAKNEVSLIRRTCKRSKK